MKSVSFHEEHIKAAFNLTGFTELKSVFESEQELMLPVSVISANMKDKYNFTDAKISGIILRAVQKHLLFKAGRGVYVLNLEYPERTADYIEDMVESKTDVRNIVLSEIDTCIKNINRKITVSDLNQADFEWLSSVMTGLKAFHS